MCKGTVIGTATCPDPTPKRGIGPSGTFLGFADSTVQDVTVQTCDLP